eukprot:10373862-Prorocentrum_lima.AAC.1
MIFEVLGETITTEQDTDVVMQSVPVELGVDGLMTNTLLEEEAGHAEVENATLEWARYLHVMDDIDVE